MAEACPTGTGGFSPHPLGLRPNRRPKPARLSRGTGPAAGNRSRRPQRATDFYRLSLSTPDAGYPPNRAPVSAKGRLHRGHDPASSGPAPFDETLTIVHDGFMLALIFEHISGTNLRAHGRPV